MLFVCLQFGGLDGGAKGGIAEAPAATLQPNQLHLKEAWETSHRSGQPTLFLTILLQFPETFQKYFDYAIFEINPSLLAIFAQKLARELQ